MFNLNDYGLKIRSLKDGSKQSVCIYWKITKPIPKNLIISHFQTISQSNCIYWF